MVVDTSKECPNFHQNIASSNHLHLYVSNIEYEFRLYLKIFHHPLSSVCRHGLNCATHDIPKVRSFQHQCHVSRPCEVVRASKLVEVVVYHGNQDEQGSAMRWGYKTGYQILWTNYQNGWIGCRWRRVVEGQGHWTMQQGKSASCRLCHSCLDQLITRHQQKRRDEQRKVEKEESLVL